MRTLLISTPTSPAILTADMTVLGWKLPPPSLRTVERLPGDGERLARGCGYHQLLTVRGDRHQEAGAGALLLLGTGVHHALAPHPGMELLLLSTGLRKFHSVRRCLKYLSIPGERHHHRRPRHVQPAVALAAHAVLDLNLGLPAVHLHQSERSIVIT